MGYRSPENLVFYCFCPKGYAGMQCEINYSIGFDSEAIFKSLRTSNDAGKKPTERGPEFVAYKNLPGFGRAFVLTRVLIQEDATISRVEYHAATPGDFMVAVSFFFWFP